MRAEGLDQFLDIERMLRREARKAAHNAGEHEATPDRMCRDCPASNGVDVESFPSTGFRKPSRKDTQ